DDREARRGNRGSTRSRAAAAAVARGAEDATGFAGGEERIGGKTLALRPPAGTNVAFSRDGTTRGSQRLMRPRQFVTRGRHAEGSGLEEAEPRRWNADRPAST